MPKIIEYPRASLRASLDLAKHVAELGGEARTPTVAEKMGLKVTGAFSALIGAAVKFSLVVHSAGVLSTTPLFREYRLAYTETDACKVLQKAFFSVPLFQKVYHRFLKQKLPVEILDKLLVREFEVDEVMASRVGGYLIDAARTANLLDEQNIFLSPDEEQQNSASSENDQIPDEDASSQQPSEKAEPPPSQFYVVEFSGPGINSKISIREAEDLEIVEATLKKIKKKMVEASMTSPI